MKRYSKSFFECRPNDYYHPFKNDQNNATLCPAGGGV